MSKLLLVTTALNETFPENDKPILFLGEWCRLYSQKDRWQNLDAEVVKYHWNDRKKLYKDYQYLIQLFERILEHLAIELNKFHKVSYSLRYWRIIIGPWLISFVSVIFDRWSNLNYAMAKYPITNTNILDGVDLNYLPESMEHYCNLVTSDLWNHVIYSSILKYIKFKKISFIKPTSDIPRWEINKETDNENIFLKIKNKIIASTSFFSKNNDYFLIDTYLNKTDTIKLHLKLGQFPFFQRKHKITQLIPRKINRNITLSEFKCESPFEEFVKKVIPLQIPKTYIEGYKNLSKFKSKVGWPEEPKLIWTSISHHMDEIFKFWAAEKVDKGVPLIIGQHGGNYGLALLNMSEYSELKMSDYYFSWGWGAGVNKIIPVGTFKKPVKKRKNNSRNTRMLLTISGGSRYSDTIQSMPISSQWIDYFNDQMKFYEKLPKYIKTNTTIRTYPYDYKWSQFQRWIDSFPNAKIVNPEEKFNHVIANTDLVISGWNTTTFLESILSMVPTVIFWDPKYFEIRKDEKELFENLKKVGIYHESPVSAAKHVKNIWKDTYSWWNKPEVTFVRNEFTNRHAYSNNIITNLHSILKNIPNIKN